VRAAGDAKPDRGTVALMAKRPTADMIADPLPLSCSAVLREGQGSILNRWSFSLWQGLISILVDDSQIGSRVPPFPEILLGLGSPGAFTLALRETGTSRTQNESGHESDLYVVEHRCISRVGLRRK
jgi:hypothetical protein